MDDIEHAVRAVRAVRVSPRVWEVADLYYPLQYRVGRKELARLARALREHQPDAMRRFAHRVTGGFPERIGL